MDAYDYGIIKDLIVDTVGPEFSSISDCAYHGVASGCAGKFIYTYYCVDFYNRHNEVLWDMINDAADEQGVKPLEFISALNGCGDVCDHDSLATIIVWYAVEYVCQEIDNDALECSACSEKYTPDDLLPDIDGYCSKECYNEDNKPDVCSWCNQEFQFDSKTARFYPFCSDGCKTQYEEL